MKKNSGSGAGQSQDSPPQLQKPCYTSAAFEYCLRLNPYQHSRWRLPTDSELVRLANARGHRYLGMHGGYYWSSRRDYSDKTKFDSYDEKGRIGTYRIEAPVLFVGGQETVYQALMGTIQHELKLDYGQTVDLLVNSITGDTLEVKTHHLIAAKETVMAKADEETKMQLEKASNSNYFLSTPEIVSGPCVNGCSSPLKEATNISWGEMVLPSNVRHETQIGVVCALETGAKP